MATQRKSPRIAIELEAGIQNPGQKDHGLPQTATIRDLSQDGAYIETPIPFKEGELVTFSIKVFGDQKKRLLFGRVRWVKDQETPPGVGIKFVKTRTLEETLKMIRNHTWKL